MLNGLFLQDVSRRPQIGFPVADSEGIVDLVLGCAGSEGLVERPGLLLVEAARGYDELADFGDR